MLNLLYENYPYGNAEAFVEYEMRALASNNEKFNIFVLRGADKTKKRFVPDNAKIFFMQNKSFKILLLAFFRMFKKCSLKEIFKVMKKGYSEGSLRCLYRIYRYQTVAVGFELQYKKFKSDNSQDIFVSYWLNECAFALTELKKKYPNIKVASRGHGFDVFEERCYLPFRKEILCGLDKIFLINAASKNYFENHYGEWLDSSKIKISHLGVNLPKIIPQKENRKIFRIATCSSVIPLKRLDLIIDALSLLRNKKIEWVHFGGGALLAHIEEYAEQKLMDSSIEYIFMGQQPLEEIHNYYASTQIHLFVNCSDTEGTPVSIMEAMSYGIPVVARNVGGMGEVLDNSCGLLLPAEESVELLSKAIEQFYDLEDEEYIKFCENSRKKIESEFNASSVFKEYIEDICRI